MEKLERQFDENPRRYAAPFAEALRKNHELERALEVIRIGLNLNPDYIPGSVILGRCQLDLGDEQAAEVAFSRVLELDQENVIALKALADITERQGRLDESERLLRYLLEVDRSNEEAEVQLGRVRVALETPAAPESVAGAEAASGPEPMVPADSEEVSAGIAEDEDEDFEPTRLWEPSAEELEAPTMSDVEPTASEEPADLEPMEPLVAESTRPTEPLEPVTGLEMNEFEPPGDAFDYEDLAVVQAEEIILEAAASTEYQVPNDAETLGYAARAGTREPEPPEPFEASEPEPDDAESPVEAATPTETVVPAPTPVEASAAAVPFEEDELPESPPEEEPVLVVTESMADLYAAQGHRTEALGVYRILLDRNPDNARLRQCVQDLERDLAAQVLAEAAPSYAASMTGGRSVSSFFAAMMNSRPAAVDLPAVEPSAPAPAAPPSDGASATEPDGEPTRPAGDRLSLSAIFGEDASPVPPAAPPPPASAPASPPPGGFSFDDFFGGAPRPAAARTSGGTPRPARAAAEEDDLDQFHAWLQSLKR
jgi:tetratricopeptide (TPR) repeat protein